MDKSRKKILIRVFWGAFWVASLIELINSAASTVDYYYVGHYVGNLGIAAMSLVRPFFSFTGIIGGPLGLGLQLVCSSHIAKGETNSAQKVFNGVFVLGLICSTIFAILGIIFTDTFISMYGTKNGVAEVLPFAKDYLRALFIGAPAIILYAVMTPTIQLVDGKKRVTASMIMHIIVAIMGDSVSVFIVKGGMFGIGLATSISYYVALVPYIHYLTRKDAIFGMKLTFMGFTDLKDVLNSGSSVAIKRVSNTLKPIILNGLSLLLGTALAVSAYGITSQVRDTLISFSAGVAGSVVLLGAVLYAEKNRASLEYLAKIALAGIGVVTGIGVLLIIFSHYVAALFITDSKEVLDMASLSIRCVGLMIPLSTFNGVYISFMQITKRFKVVNILSFLNRIVLLVVTSAVMGVVFGTNGLWWAFPVSELINLIICIFVTWKINGRLPTTIADFLCLPEDFGYKSGGCIEFSPQSIQDIPSILDAINEFCTSHEIDSKRTVFTQLVTEELTINVIQHGFAKCKHKPLLAICLVFDNDVLYLRIQDNCPKFNVRDYCCGLLNGDLAHGVGLKCVAKLAKDMQYMNTLEINTLSITM